MAESTAHIAHKNANMSSKKQRKWLPHIFTTVMSKLRQLRGISQARVLTCWIATASNPRAENGQQLLVSLSNRPANMSHRPHSIHQFIVYAYSVSITIMAGTLPTHPGLYTHLVRLSSITTTALLDTSCTTIIAQQPISNIFASAS